MYIAHRKDKNNVEEIQTVKEHSKNTAEMARYFAIQPLKDYIYLMGLLHDIGKYQSSFQDRIEGKNIRVEHSTCGAIAVMYLREDLEKNYKANFFRMLQLCIVGHHSGLPDMGNKNDDESKSTFYGRMKREFEDFSIWEEDLKEFIKTDIDIMEYWNYIFSDCNKEMEKVIDKYAFLTRYCFSCLTDADSIDTIQFMLEKHNTGMKSDFEKCLIKVDNLLKSFDCKTKLQATRAGIQSQAFENINKKSEIYLMNMPTGSGKTLCSVKCALERIRLDKSKKRVIYVIPYNSIIDQTAEVFNKLFGEEVDILLHQSTFSVEDLKDVDEDYKQVVKMSTENWDADFIITTTVQFFESIYANKRSKLRRLHNMSDSIIIFDEVHRLPEKFLQPCLEAVAYLTKYLNSEAIFLTATMPDFKNLIKQLTFENIKITDLITDSSNFKEFKKCNYKYIGDITSETLIEKTLSYSSSLIIVNKKKTARKLYELCNGKRFHLSTYMTSDDRKKVISDIKKELYELEKDFPKLTNVPEDRRITVISTSLIEAGVDLDFYTVFRELTGLDSILQAGGRCNREGKREKADVFIFGLEEEKDSIKDDRTAITSSLIKKFDDISTKESLDEYYNKLFFFNKDILTKMSMYKFCNSINNIPFEKYYNEFKIIDDRSKSIIILSDNEREKLISEIKFVKVNLRTLQKYTCSVNENELNELIKQGVIVGMENGLYILANNDYYDRELGILFEPKDYYIDNGDSFLLL